jgi:hypothetical protein
MRQCNKCKQNKAAEDFHKGRAECKECNNQERRFKRMKKGYSEAHKWSVLQQDLRKQGKKKCTYCLEIKSIDEFRYQKHRKTYQSNCKKCQSKKQSIKKKAERAIRRAERERLRQEKREKRALEVQAKKQEKEKLKLAQQQEKQQKEQLKLDKYNYCLENQVKICSKCKQEKKWSEFNKSNKKVKAKIDLTFGLGSRCRSCSKIYSKKHYQENRELFLEKGKKYYQDILNDPEAKAHRLNYARNYRKQRTKTDPIFRFKCSVRRCIRDAFKRKNKTKSKKALKYLGCTWNEFMDYMEKQFQPGMSFDNYGFDGWHIDHIVPLATAKTEEQVAKLNHYTNLQPLWAKDNMSKGAKII